MALSQVFLGFLQPVAFGSATVFALFLVIGLKTQRRSTVFVSRRSPR